MAQNKLEFFPRLNEAQLENLCAFNNLFRKYSQIAIDNFEYSLKDGTPLQKLGLESRRFETPLFNTGFACFFYNDQIGFCVLPAVVRGDLDIYGEPTKWTAQGIGGTFQVDETNSVLFRNDLFGYSGIELAQYYAKKVSDVQRTIDTQVFLHKMPFLVKGTDKDILSKKNILEKKKDNELAIFVNSKVTGDDFEVFNTPTPYIIDRLFAYKQELEAEYFAMLGYNNNPQEKRERLLVDEINANNEFTENGYAGAMYQMRKNACDKVEAMFGVPLDVNIKRVRVKTPEFYEIVPQGQTFGQQTNEDPDTKEGE
jgi:hypothetical protein